jgi:hypothetical protein
VAAPTATVAEVPAPSAPSAAFAVPSRSARLAESVRPRSADAPAAPLSPPETPALKAPATTPQPTAPLPTTPAPPPAPPPPITPETLQAETRLVRTGIAALRAGDASRALASFDEHARLFPAGALAEERAAERVDALCALGRTSDAWFAASAFLRDHPSSPYGARMRSGCAAVPRSGTKP